MKKFLSLTLAMALMIFFTACGSSAQNSENKTSAQSTGSAPDTENKTTAESADAAKKSLVVFFSRTGEEYRVGNITKGNTHIVADFIAENVGAKTFEIKPVNPYPDNYNECTELAKREQQEKARPAIANKIDNFDDYDVIYLGYPNWWSDMPMIIYTFLESYNFNGKTIIPFCTSSSEHFIGKEEIQQYAKGATVLDGLGIEGKRCQDDPASVKRDVDNWLKKING